MRLLASATKVAGLVDGLLHHLDGITVIGAAGPLQVANAKKWELLVGASRFQHEHQPAHQHQ